MKAATKLSGVVFLAADTIRSRAYGQAMAAKGMRLDAVLLVTSPGKAKWGQVDHLDPGDNSFKNLFLPDLSLPLSETIRQLSDDIDQTPVGTLNAPEVVAWIKAKAPCLVVFSGFGGELTKENVLDAGAPLLHIHAGWLPDYRGSTTSYYSYLQEQSFGVSAIFLTKDIDTGPLIARQRYPAPPPGFNVDYYYDSMIRSDLLTRVLAQWADKGEFPDMQKQSPEQGTTYYIIHPVLKHIALNAMNRAQ